MQCWEFRLKRFKNFQIAALVIMDKIWHTRNKLIFEDIIPVPQTLLKSIRLATSLHLRAWSHGNAELSLWVPPPVGSFKVNFDVAIRHLLLWQQPPFEIPLVILLLSTH
jgi:hypothetical protein